MKNLKIEHIVYTSWNKDKNEYKYSVYCEDDIYKFIIEEKKANDNNYWSKKNEYKIMLDMSSIIGNQHVVDLCSNTPIQALCSYLKYDCNKFKNDIYVNIDKTHFFDYVKELSDEYSISIPINSIYTPNTNRSSADTICALLDMEHKSLEDDFDYDYLDEVMDKLLSYDKLYLQPFLNSLTNHMFHEFLTDEEIKEKEDLNRKWLHIPDNFERKFKSYDDEIEFKRTYEDENDDRDYSIEKIEFTIKHNIHYKDPYKDYDSDTMNAAGLVMGGLATVFALKSAMNIIKKD